MRKACVAFLAGIAVLLASPGVNANGDSYDNVPGLEPIVIVNTIGLELPRAQYTDGPWVRFKGGELNDSKEALYASTYQTVQVGWDKTFDVRNGVWNAGIFAETNWMYSSSEYDLLQIGQFDTFKSRHNGVGAGLYLGREFRNRTYFDVVGRVAQFGNTVEGKVIEEYDGDVWGEYDLVSHFSNQIFSAAIEVGRTFQSRDNRYSLTVYNRLIYTGTSSSEFAVIDRDGYYAIAKANIDGFGGWTNRLGGRLTFNQLFGSPRRTGYYGQAPCLPLCDPCGPCDPCGFGNGRASNIQLFVGADYYKGLDGKFGATFTDYWDNVVAQHGKNNMSYGVASVGMTLIPTNNLSLGIIGESVFGDVEGYGLTFMTKVTF